MNDIHNSPMPSMVKATLYFGVNIPTGGMVSHERFAEYLTGVIPHFPGFTITEGHGYWKGEPEMVRMLTILAPDTKNLRHQIRAFAEQYKSMFEQEAVAYEFVPCQFTLDCWPYGPVKAYHQLDKGTAYTPDKPLSRTNHA